jgi:hypothetical protein
MEGRGLKLPFSNNPDKYLLVEANTNTWEEYRKLVQPYVGEFWALLEYVTGAGRDHPADDQTTEGCTT